MTASDPPENISLVLLAENRLLREALTKVLNKKSGMRVVASFSFSHQALKLAAAALPQVLLLDADTLACSNGEIVRQAQKELTATKLVMVGMGADGPTFLRLVREGVVGYLLKDASATEIENAVRAVVGGEAACPPKLCLALFNHMARQCNQMPSFYARLQFGLTSRE
jgi:DNA-binding NarL/FixJ family response regulator